jgi:invasion protein IalB
VKHTLGAAGALALSLVLLAACGRTAAGRAPSAAAPPPAAAPPAPAKHYTMVCRNSQNGRKAECGTPNAVMVGMKAD